MVTAGSHVKHPFIADSSVPPVATALKTVEG